MQIISGLFAGIAIMFFIRAVKSKDLPNIIKFTGCGIGFAILSATVMLVEIATKIK